MLMGCLVSYQPDSSLVFFEGELNLDDGASVVVVMLVG